jgi:hypothetical protein
LSLELAASWNCVILQAYFDESTKDGYYVVGGYVAPIGVWRRWNDSWNTQLKKKPILGFFRSTDAMALKGQFTHFHEDQRNERVLALAETLPTENFFGVHAYTKIEDFNRLFSSRFKGSVIDPFYICAFALVTYLNMDLLKAKPIPKTVDYFFDRQDKVERNFVDVSQFAAFTSEKDYFPFVGDFRFEDKTKFLPLQAADMCVSWARRQASRNKGFLNSDVVLAKQKHLSYSLEPDFLLRMANKERMEVLVKESIDQAEAILKLER